MTTLLTIFSFRAYGNSGGESSRKQLFRNKRCQKETENIRKKFQYTLNDEAKSGTVILGDIGYRKDQHKTYDESSLGYFLVDETVALVEDMIENSEDLTNK